MNAIEINDLEKVYGDTIAVNKINLSIKEGELFALLGVNGAGKTTTIKLLTCLIKPTSGDASLFDYSIKKDIDKIKKIVSVSPQETAVAPNLTVKENLLFISEIYGIKQALKKTDEIINLFKLDKVKQKKAKTLSGGMQRRLSIAMALITEPRILFLDEPTLGLDVLARRELWQVIEDLKGKITIILTTHYMEEVEYLADRVAVMASGQIKSLGTVKQLTAKTKTKNLEEAFIMLASKEN